MRACSFYLSTLHCFWKPLKQQFGHAPGSVAFGLPGSVPHILPNRGPLCAVLFPGFGGYSCSQSNLWQGALWQKCPISVIPSSFIQGYQLPGKFNKIELAVKTICNDRQGAFSNRHYKRVSSVILPSSKWIMRLP